jgi:hypothetical protein
VGLNSEWFHTEKIGWIAATAGRATDSDMSDWRRKFSCSADDIHMDWKVDDLVIELQMYRREWTTFKDGSGVSVPDAMLPHSMQHEVDESKNEGHWKRPLSSWTDLQIKNKTKKPRLCGMLAAARQVLTDCDVLRPPPRPSAATSSRETSVAGELAQQLKSHPLLRELPPASVLGKRSHA